MKKLSLLKGLYHRKENSEVTKKKVIENVNLHIEDDFIYDFSNIDSMLHSKKKKKEREKEEVEIKNEPLSEILKIETKEESTEEEEEERRRKIREKEMKRHVCMKILKK